MDIQNVIKQNKIDFSGIPSNYFLLGLLTAFDNRFQASADKVMGVISWKQFFAVVCINLCREPPTLKELSDIMGSSHQNVKQILLKLEKKGFAELKQDPSDKRKQRIHLTEKCKDFCSRNDRVTGEIMDSMFRGISEENLQITIQTILKIEENMKENEK